MMHHTWSPADSELVPAQGIAWDDRQIKALLQFQLEKLPPQHCAWIKQQGGPEAVIDTLLAYPLTPTQRKLLTLIVAAPGEAQPYYAAQLKVHRSTFSEWWSHLARRLASFLNAQTWPVPAVHRTIATMHTVIPFPGADSAPEDGPGLEQVYRTLIEVQQAVHQVEQRLAAIQHIPPAVQPTEVEM